MAPWAWITLCIAALGLIGTLAAILAFAAGARVADAIVQAFKEHRL